MQRVFLPHVGRFALLAALGSAAAASHADELPAPVQALANQGLTIHGQFEAPGECAALGPALRARIWRFI